MKKKILALLITAVLSAGVIGGITAYAEVSPEECDRCFQNTVSVFLDREDVLGNKITAERKPVYDIKLGQLGYVYEFPTAKGEGYAIIICDGGEYAAVEVFADAQSPYAEVGEGEQNVFVNNMSYYKAVDGEIRTISTDEVVSEEVCAVLAENAIIYENSGLVQPEYVTVSVEYQSVDEDFYEMSYICPRFSGSGLTGGCAAVAGGNIIGYYDRYYEDLIPNHTAGKLVSGNYWYAVGDTYVYEAINTLYADMNGNGSGINETNFKNGLQTYCSRKGLSCTFNSLKKWGELNFDLVKSSMKNGKPVALLLNTYNVCDLMFFDDKDVMHYMLLNGNHVMVGFGYRDINYTLSDGSVSNYKFIYVATGFSDPNNGYFNVNYNTNIVSAYGVDIH